MKITETKLKQIIKEQIIKELDEKQISVKDLVIYVFDNWYKITDEEQAYVEETGEFPTEIIKLVNMHNVDFEEFQLEYMKFMDLNDNYSDDDWGDDDWEDERDDVEFI